MSRTARAGSFGSPSPLPKAIPSVNSRHYASIRVMRYSGVSEGWYATRRARDS